MHIIRKHLLFYGEVQGVGFRFTARSLAHQYGVTGWVKNLYDGSVEMEAEGTPRDIDALIDGLGKSRWIYIERIEEQEIPVQGGYDFTY